MAKTNERHPDSASKPILALDEYYALFSDKGYALIELIYDKDGRPVDFIHFEINHNDRKIASLSGNIDHRMSGLGAIRQYWLEIYADVISTGRAKQIEHYAEGSKRWTSIFAFRVGGPGSRLIAVVLNDITDRKQQEAELWERLKADETLRANEVRLQQLNLRLQENDKLKTDFFNNVSHEFRTPLTLLIGPLENVIQNNRSNLHPDELEKLQLAHRSAVRLQKIVNTLLDFARIEAGKIEAFYQPTDFTKITVDLASNFRSAIESAGLKYVVKAENIKEPIYLNREMWEKIVFNLLSNALKFTHKGKIQLVIHEKNRSVEFRVKDTGVGIAKKHIDRIFDRFARIENKKGRTSEGTGIGLALVRELVWAHKGNIKVRSEEGLGSEFIVTMLKGKSHLNPKQIYENKKQLPAMLTNDSFVEEALTWLPEDATLKRRQEREYNQNKNIRILLADDNTDMRNYLTGILSDKYNVLGVEHGRKVVDFLEKGGQADLIVADVMMPEMNGYELVDFLKSKPKYHDIPIILLSARSTEEAKIEGLNIGADYYLVKPFSTAELRALINSRVTKLTKPPAHK